MLEGEEYSADSYSCVDPPSPEKKNKRKRRFSDEQIRSLESMFESQTKVEPRKKLQLARELGLQPRQVVIWFQNKRARWKSKQLEREYGTLRADYDALLSSFESLKKEKQSLLKHLQKLAVMLEKPPPEGKSNCGTGKEDKKLNWALTEGSDLRVTVHSEGGEQTISYLQKQEPDLLYMGEPTDGCLSVAEQRPCFDDAGCFSDQSGNSSQWWEFWALNE